MWFETDAWCTIVYPVHIRTLLYLDTFTIKQVELSESECISNEVNEIQLYYEVKVVVHPTSKGHHTPPHLPVPI